MIPQKRNRTPLNLYLSASERTSQGRKQQMARFRWLQVELSCIVIFCTTEKEKMLPVKLWLVISSHVYPDLKDVKCGKNVHSRIDKTGYQQGLCEVNVGRIKLSYFTIDSSVSLHLFQQACIIFIIQIIKMCSLRKENRVFQTVAAWLFFWRPHVLGTQ